MLSSCLRMRLESGRLLILAMIPATKGKMVAAQLNKRQRGALARRLFEFIGDQQAHAETDRGLRRNNARHRKVVAEFIE